MTQPDVYVPPPKPPTDQPINGGVGRTPDIINIIHTITETPVRRGGLRWGDRFNKLGE